MLNSESECERLKSFHKDFMEVYEQSDMVSRKQRLRSRDDRRFVHEEGAQWEGSRLSDRPKLELNKLRRKFQTLMGSIRSAQTDISVSTDATASDKRSLASAMETVLRQDWINGKGHDFIVGMLSEICLCGMGAGRLCLTDGSDENGILRDAQRLEWEWIREADINVLFNVDAVRSDKSDATHCFILHTLSERRFKERFKRDKVPPSITGLVGLTVVNGDFVRIAEVYHRKLVDKVLVLFANDIGDVREVLLDENGEDKNGEDIEYSDWLISVGYREIERKKAKAWRVFHYVMSSDEILEDNGETYFNRIPVYVAYVNHNYINGVEHFYGYAQSARDPQSVLNYSFSVILDTLSRGSQVSVPVAFREQVERYADRWGKSAIKNFPFQMIDPVVDEKGQKHYLPLQGWTQPTNLSNTVGLSVEMSEKLLEDMLGMDERANQMPPAASGRWLEEMSRRHAALDASILFAIGLACNNSLQEACAFSGKRYTLYGYIVRSINRLGTVEYSVSNTITIVGSHPT